MRAPYRNGGFTIVAKLYSVSICHWEYSGDICWSGPNYLEFHQLCYMCWIHPNYAILFCFWGFWAVLLSYMIIKQFNSVFNYVFVCVSAWLFMVCMDGVGFVLFMHAVDGCMDARIDMYSLRQKIFYKCCPRLFTHYSFS